MSEYLSREEASRYVRERYGKVAAVAPATLKTLATKGGGPAYSKFGRNVAYLPEDLDSWVCERLKRTRRASTSSEAPR